MFPFAWQDLIRIYIELISRAAQFIHYVDDTQKKFQPHQDVSTVWLNKSPFKYVVRRKFIWEVNLDISEVM